MFLASDTIHFSCTQCGKCCQKSPNMHFYDALDLSDEFIFQTSHHAILSYDKQPLDDALIEHYKVLGHTIIAPEFEAKLFYFIDFLPVSYPSYNNCSKLVNNQCSIYGKRPSSCKLAPFNTHFDDTQQWRTLEYFRKNTENENWQCRFDEQSPIVFKDKQIVQPAQNSLYFQSVEATRDFTDKYIDFLNFNQERTGKHYKDEHLKAIFQSVIKNNLMISDMIVPLQIARYHNIISEELALTFINNQINLMDKEINLATQQKRKEDLKTSQLYKKQKENYIKAIKQKMFQTDSDDISII